MTGRLETLVRNIPEEIDAVLIRSPVNRRYYLGFPSSAGTVVVTRTKNYFIIDSRYFEAASAAVKNCEVVLQDKLYDQLGFILKKHRVKRVGIECDFIVISEFKRLEEKLSGVKILMDDRISRLIAKQRGVKSQDEIACIQAAQDISDKTFSHILNFIKPGRTELEIAVEMEYFSRREGSEEPAFSYIVAAGTNSSRPHAVPGENKVKDGDFITLDFGSTVNGYRSDMTRTVAVGSISEKQREVYALALKAQLAALGMIKAGVNCFDVDKAARDIIDATRYRGLFRHGLGHSLGLEVHEAPSFSSQCKDALESGMVMSVEPGIYIAGSFGVRIEDIIAVRENGFYNFVKSAKDLIIL